MPYNENKLSQGYWQTALLIDGQLCYIQTVTNAQSRPHRKQVYAHTGVHWAALDKYAAMIFFVAVPGYKQMTLVVPTEDMRKVLSCGSKHDDRVSLYIPLAYHPNDPVLDFLAYEDAWGAIPLATRLPTATQGRFCIEPVLGARMSEATSGTS